MTTLCNFVGKAEWLMRTFFRERVVKRRPKYETFKIPRGRSMFFYQIIGKQQVVTRKIVSFFPQRQFPDSSNDSRIHRESIVLEIVARLWFQFYRCNGLLSFYDMARPL
eukprot:scaffold3103_cov136-Cylindrotheca_fusiformis.AAC.34